MTTQHATRNTQHATRNTQKCVKLSSSQGFTLIEMSIVLIIIGLVVGGIFVGTDLYNAAKVRKTISEFQEFTIATTTFRVRYKCLPGDCRKYEVFGGVERTRADAKGDGDWAIESNVSYLGPLYELFQCSERRVFWADLFDAGLINTTSSAGDFSCPNITAETGLASYLPKSQWGDDVFWFIANDPNEKRKHYLYLAQVSSVDISGRPYSTNRSPIPSHIAKQIDKALDDGLPTSGKVIGGYIDPSGGGRVWTNDDSECLTGDTPPQYNLDGDGCSLRFEARF